MITKETLGESDLDKIAFINDGKSILLCNYRLELTKREYELVLFLANEKGWTTREKIICNTGVRRSSIPVHVANANKKAYSVSGRKLLEGNRSGEYRVAEYI